ncbi:antitoxin MazE-like protein [Pyramidobacter sp.]|uniref:antitoxin MazE-like protein n=1 Tax=Pyramidobacter sp. TaxID=1943581 RepID=UPI0039C5D9CE
MIDMAERNERKRLSVARRRSALRSEGYRPVQLWVPDLRNREVRGACARFGSDSQ